MSADRNPPPLVLQGDAASLPLPARSVDIVVTSPPYNVGGDRRWVAGARSPSGGDRSTGGSGVDSPGETGGRKPGGGSGRTSPGGGSGRTSPGGGSGRTSPGGGAGMFDGRREHAYRTWQQQVLNECHRVATDGASLFYVHRVRISDGELTHPVQWLRSDENPWLLRQEIPWKHGVIRDNDRSMFNPVDERVYWLTKGPPDYSDPGIQQDSLWEFSGSRADTTHPTAFPEELPRRCLDAVAQDGDVVLDPMAGSMTTCEVASAMGYPSIGVEVDREYIPAGL